MLEVVTDVVDDGRVQAGRDGTVNRFAYAAAAHRAGERDKGLTSVDSPAIAELVGDLFKPTIAVGLDLEVVAALSVSAAGGRQAVRKKRRQASRPSPAICQPAAGRQAEAKGAAWWPTSFRRRKRTRWSS
jgi:hypothetical protein